MASFWRFFGTFWFFLLSTFWKGIPEFFYLLLLRFFALAQAQKSKLLNYWWPPAAATGSGIYTSLYEVLQVNFWERGFVCHGCMPLEFSILPQHLQLSDKYIFLAVIDIALDIWNFWMNSIYVTSYLVSLRSNNAQKLQAIGTIRIYFLIPPFWYKRDATDDLNPQNPPCPLGRAREVDRNKSVFNNHTTN